MSRLTSASSITGKIIQPAAIAAWGVLAAVIGTRAAIAAAGAVLLTSGALLPWRTAQDEPVPDPHRAGVQRTP